MILRKWKAHGEINVVQYKQFLSVLVLNVAQY